MQELNEKIAREQENQTDLTKKVDLGMVQTEDKQKDAAQKERKPEKKGDFLSFRYPASALFRGGILFLGLIFFIASGILFYFGNMPETEEVEKILYTYEHQNEVGYDVKLLPNTVFEEEWLPEGRVYSLKLTDLIRIRFDSVWRVTNSSKLSGDYIIEAVLHAFQMNEQSVSTIYEKKYRLAEGKIDGTGEFRLQEAVEVRPADFSTLVAQIEEEMGGSANKEFNIILSGTVYIEDEQKPQEKTFSHKVGLPINSTDVYYSIMKPEAVNESENATVADVVTIKKQPMLIYSAVALLASGIILWIVALLLTKAPDPKTRRKMVLRKILKKHEERIVGVSQLPPFRELSVLELSDFDAMLNHSEDIRELILVQFDAENLPVDNKFYLYTRDKVFVYEERMK